MKLIKKIVAILLALSSVSTIASCSLLDKFDKNSHTHTWKNYIVKAPTCTATGLLEKLCEECGEKEYEDIVKSDHAFQNGICAVCGTSGQSGTSINPIPMPSGANNTAAWSMNKIYDTAVSVANYNASYDSFIQQLSTGRIQDIYLDELGMFHVTAIVRNREENDLELPLAFIVGKVSPTNTQETELENIYRVEVTNGEMLFTYSDGLQVSAGRVTDLYGGTIITALGLTPNNELVVYYSDNTLAFAGKVLVGNAPENQATFMYREVEGGYHVAEVFDSASEVLIIPTSHRGKPIIGIDSGAFQNMKSTVTAIVIPETVTNITTQTFSGLHLANFIDNVNGTKLYFEGTSPFGANVSLPMDFAYASYFKGEWSYVNGIPTPNK